MTDPQPPSTNEKIIKPLIEGSFVPKPVVMGILVFVLVLGSITGFVLASLQPKSQKAGGTDASIQKVQTDTKAGIIDKKTFTDTATGVLRDGGLEGEGSHHLERGAKDQTAYLTSSTVDLTPYIGKKVQVWGQTNTGQKTGWLMDVGYIEIVK